MIKWILLIGLGLQLPIFAQQENEDSLQTEIPAEKIVKDDCNLASEQAEFDFSHQDYYLRYHEGAPWSKRFCEILYDEYRIKVIPNDTCSKQFCDCYSEKMMSSLLNHFGNSIWNTVTNQIKEEEKKAAEEETDN